MLDYRLSKQELVELRINAVISLGNGRTAADVADALLIDPDAVRTYFKRFKQGVAAQAVYLAC